MRPFIPYGEVHLPQLYADGMYQAYLSSVVLLLSKHIVFGCKVTNSVSDTETHSFALKSLPL